MKIFINVDARGKNFLGKKFLPSRALPLQKLSAFTIMLCFASIVLS